MSRRSQCCSKVPSMASCCALPGVPSSLLFQDGFDAGLPDTTFNAVFQNGAGSVATAESQAVVTIQPAGGFQRIQLATAPVISPANDFFCICFDLNPSIIAAASNAQGAAGGLERAFTGQDGPNQQLLVIGGAFPSFFSTWRLLVSDGVNPNVFFNTFQPVIQGQAAHIRMCRLPTDPPNTIRVSVNGVENSFVAPLPTATLRASIIAANNNFVQPQVVRSGNFCGQLIDNPCPDCTAQPTITCLNGVVVNIADGAPPSATVFAADVVNTINVPPECQPYQLSISKGTSPTPIQASVSFDCNELGSQPIRVFVIDCNGKVAFCDTTVNVQDNGGFCL